MNSIDLEANFLKTLIHPLRGLPLPRFSHAKVTVQKAVTKSLLAPTSDVHQGKVNLKVLGTRWRAVSVVLP